MASKVSEVAALDAAVRDFLREHSADAEFQKVTELVQTCFPALLGLDATVQQDGDEEGRAQAVVRVRLPDSCPDEGIRLGLRRYHERVVDELSPARCPLFAAGARRHLQAVGRLPP